MLEDRDYMRAGWSRWHWSATVALIAALVIAFLVQVTLVPVAFADEYLALSLDGIRRGFIWQLVTFQFLHGGWIHLLANCLAIYFFGREVEWVLGKSRYFTLYLGSGVVGGLLQMFGAWIWPNHLGGAVVGASAGGFGLVAAFAALDPERQLTMLLYFLIPVRMRAKTLLFVCLGLSGLGIAFPQTAFGGNIAHAAHLGGILTGIAWIKCGWHRDYVRLPWEGWLDGYRRWHPFRARRRKRELVNAASVKVSKWPVPRAERDLEPPPEEFISREVDPILDKISEHGIQSLTERERKILEAARNKMAKR
jgi:membrane associated rhomboid family serine protease